MVVCFPVVILVATMCQLGTSEENAHHPQPPKPQFNQTLVQMAIIQNGTKGMEKFAGPLNGTNGEAKVGGQFKGFASQRHQRSVHVEGNNAKNGTGYQGPNAPRNGQHGNGTKGVEKVAGTKKAAHQRQQRSAYEEGAQGQIEKVSHPVNVTRGEGKFGGAAFKRQQRGTNVDVAHAPVGIHDTQVPVHHDAVTHVTVHHDAAPTHASVHHEAVTHKTHVTIHHEAQTHAPTHHA